MERNIQRLLYLSHAGKYRHHFARSGRRRYRDCSQSAGTDRAGSGPAGLYHLLNHSLFKSVLSRAGSIWFRVPVIAISKNWAVLVNGCYFYRHAGRSFPWRWQQAAAAERLCRRVVIYQSFFKLGNSGAFVVVC